MNNTSVSSESVKYVAQHSNITHLSLIYAKTILDEETINALLANDNLISLGLPQPDDSRAKALQERNKKRLIKMTMFALFASNEQDSSLLPSLSRELFDVICLQAYEQLQEELYEHEYHLSLEYEGEHTQNNGLPEK